MAITELIPADTAAAHATLEITGNVVIAATKLADEEYVFIHIYGLAGDTEVVNNNKVATVLSNKNNSAQLVGPCKYEVYKPLTAASLGIGYYA